MAGTANTSKFVLGAATVMVGAQSALFDMQPATHGIGLVKNFSVTFEPTSIDLTQGIRNSVVMSVVNGGDVRAQMEVFEYTSKNLSWGLGLDGTSVAPQTVNTTLTSAVDGTITPTSTVPVTSATGLNVNDYIMIIDSTADDKVVTRKITAVVSLNLTVTPAIGTLIPTGSVVNKVNLINAGNPTDGLFLGAKVVGILADGSKCQLMFPKIRIVRGFTMAFTTDNFGNMPFEFKMLDLVSTDPNFAAIGPLIRGQIYLQG